jgi:FKBP-type peptidyl-prolyl cis-trans isomerase
MRSTSFGTVALAALLSAACSAAPEASLDTEDQQASYAIGLDMGSSLAPAQGLLDVPALMKGIEDAINEAEPALDPEVRQAALQAFSSRVRDAQMARMEEEGAENREAGAAYLAENGAREGVTTTESGLQYEVITPAEGPTPAAEDQVRIHYRGTLVDGTEFDSSYSRGEPSQFGVGGVIPGFAEGLQLMEVGSSYRFVIPSDIAYGPQGSGGAIGPDATLIFEVELLEIIEE